MIERTCRQRRRFADGLRVAGYEILNHVEINQCWCRFGSPRSLVPSSPRCSRGTCWFGGTEWHGRPAMRISVSYRGPQEKTWN